MKKSRLQHLVRNFHENGMKLMLELLSYIHALIYHERDPDEVPSLQDTVEQSVQTDEHRQEVFQMGKSYADVLIERGREEGREEGRGEGELTARKQTLLRLLERRFGELTGRVIQAVEAAQDMQQLDEWLDRFATATTLDEIGIK